MATIQTTKVVCDRCSGELLGTRNSLNIATSVDTGSRWKRLHVKIKSIHGTTHRAEEDDADLCQACTINLLTDALNRVKDGERATHTGDLSGGNERWDRPVLRSQEEA